MTSVSSFLKNIDRIRYLASANSFAKNLSAMGLAQIAVRASRLITTILLSRWLAPEIFATAAIVLTVYEFVSLFTRNGISSAVIQATAEDVDATAMTAWRMTWIACISLLLVQCALAYPIAWFYHNSKLEIPIIAMSAIYLVTPMSNIQAAFQQREGKLGRMALASATQVIADNILTACFALTGFDIWAIILPKLLVAPIWLIMVRRGHPWRPQNVPGIGKFYGWDRIVKYSRSVLGTEILATVQANIDNLLVGYFLGLHALGIYYFAFNAGLGLTLGFISAISVAVFPYLCEVNTDKVALASRFFQTRKRTGFGLGIIIVLQSLLAPIYVPLVFGAKWVEAAPILSIICLSALVRPYACVTGQLLKAIGKPEIEMRWQFINTIILIIALVIACQFNTLTVAIAVLAVQTSVLGLFSWFVPKMIFEHSTQLNSDTKRSAALPRLNKFNLKGLLP